jgi:hypothetical protein
MHLSSWLLHVREPTSSFAASEELQENSNAPVMPSILMDEINLRTTHLNIAGFYVHADATSA